MGYIGCLVVQWSAYEDQFLVSILQTYCRIKEKATDQKIKLEVKKKKGWIRHLWIDEKKGNGLRKGDEIELNFFGERWVVHKMNIQQIHQNNHLSNEPNHPTRLQEDGSPTNEQVKHQIITRYIISNTFGQLYKHFRIFPPCHANLTIQRRNERIPIINFQLMVWFRIFLALYFLQFRAPPFHNPS